MSSEIAPEAQKLSKVSQEAFLRGSDRQKTTTYGIPVAFHKETSHSVRNSRAFAPQLESDTTCPELAGSMQRLGVGGSKQFFRLNIFQT